MIQDVATSSEMRLRLGLEDYVWREGELLDAAGHRIPLRAKALSMFAELLAYRGRVLSKDQLSELVWPGTVATDESIARCIADIRKALKDNAFEIVQTYPKQGYRLNVIVKAQAAAQSEETKFEPPSLHGKGGVLFVAAMVSVAAIIAWILVRDDTAIDVSSASNGTAVDSLREAIAILPFGVNSDSDRFLASGLSDDLEIHLAEISAIKLISRGQVSLVADTAQGPVALARSLDVRYLVKGDVREDSGAIALSLRLIDGSDGTTLWADRYEGTRAGLMGFRDTLPEALVGAMSIELNARDQQRLALKDTDDPIAFQEVMHARQELSTFTYEGSLTAERHLRQAIARDPNYARAYAELASTFAIRMENNWVVLSSADEDKAFYFAKEALRLDEGLWFAHYALGRLHSIAESGDTQTALTHLRQAMSLQPANDDPRAYFAIVTAMSGNLEDGATILKSVIATHPQPPFWYHLGLANAQFHLKQYESALETVRVCLSQMTNSPYCLRNQIAVLARLDRIEDAEWAAEEYAILGHEVSLAALMQSAIESDPALRSHLEASYRLVGID
ncbi:winged helix-turn-helix domain-containing tetratricopeptide repeat protein [Litoreibacter janthinus]|uniref:TolB amino-terminal domain-containing protein n=1 Tax=Litoreibacter janthinus TaxID=670154 RepID=A0A1I6H5H8_9RHOB|nr:tetratricopeptide repeat protein [Litoreibacter janthinus]SFR49521.1 TolB amino-terminal domain-containing protein [Litoreibacter janthinus]